MSQHRSSPRSPFRIAAVLVLGLALFAASMLLDRAILGALDLPEAHREDWHRMLRAFGYLPLWAVVALAAALLSRRDAARRAIFLFAAPALAGVLAEALKLLLRRERPDAADPAYHFRPFSQEPFSSAGLGLPSSHATIAFAGAAALCVVAPRGWPIWLLLAGGCAFTRLADRAHYFSDTTLAALTGAGAALLLARLVRPHALGDQRL